MTNTNAPSLTKEEAAKLLTEFCSTYPHLNQGNMQRLRFPDSSSVEAGSEVCDVPCSTS